MDKIKLIQKRYRRRSLLLSHVLIYAAVIAGIWLNWITFAETAFANGHLNTLMDRIIVTVVWGLILVAHVARLAFREAEERAIMRVLESESGKAKRGIDTFEDEAINGVDERYEPRRLQLTDDGELVDSDYPEDLEPDSYHNHR